MKYPPEFSSEAQAAVEQEKILADQEFNTARDILPQYGGLEEIPKLIRGYMARMLLAFSKEACRLGRNRIWAVTQIRSHVGEFLQQIAMEAYNEKRFFRDGRRVEYSLIDWQRNGAISHEEMHQLRSFPQWKEYQDDLLEVTRIQKRPSSTPHSADGPVATRLRQLREEAGLTQEELAERVELTPRTIKRHESATTNIRSINARAYERELTKALGRPVSL